MSLTDDTNVNTNDIPLPSDPTSVPVAATAAANSSKAHTNGYNPTATQQMAAAYANAYANPYAANAVHQAYPYYPYYPPTALPFQQMPQVMAPQYPYFMPQMVRPMVPVIPQLQTSLVAQKAAISAISAKVNARAQAAQDYDEEEDEEEDESDSDPTVARKPRKASNVLPLRCNETMGLNPLIYQNIQSSPYFKNNLFQLKTYHEVIDEIYYSVKHLEPWEKGSRKVSISHWFSTSSFSHLVVLHSITSNIYFTDP